MDFVYKSQLQSASHARDGWLDHALDVVIQSAAVEGGGR